MNILKQIKKNKYPFIIAEVSANHNQNFTTLKKIIDKLLKTKVDAIKFQTFKPDGMTLKLKKDDFLIKEKNSLWKNTYLFDLYKASSMPWEWQEKIFPYIKKRGKIPFSSPFHFEAVNFLKNINCPIYKVASLENNFFPLIKKIINTNKPIIISTGASTYNEIHEVVKFLKKNNCKNYSLLKCTSSYPAKYTDLNLDTIPVMIKKFKCTIGFSDHTKDGLAAKVAVSMGAKIIEKHVKLDNKSNTLDSKFSITISDLENYIEDIRHVIDIKGDKKKFLIPNEKYARSRKRSIYVAKNIKKNELLTPKNIKIIRPARGMSSKFYYRVLGKKANRNLIAGTPLSKNLIKNKFR